MSRAALRLFAVALLASGCPAPPPDKPPPPVINPCEGLAPLTVTSNPGRVRVNGVVPGFINTYGLTEDQLREREKTVPLGRYGVAEDMTGAALFLASDDAAYITGQFVSVDGGVLVQQRSANVDTFPTSGFPVVEGGICTTLEDLARFGVMCLQRGELGGDQIVPSDWLHRPTTRDQELIDAFAPARDSNRSGPHACRHSGDSVRAVPGKDDRPGMGRR